MKEEHPKSGKWIKLRDIIRDLPPKEREEAVNEFGNNPETWKGYLDALEENDLKILCPMELLMLMHSLKTGFKETSGKTAEGAERIDDIVAAEMQEISLGFDKEGYALLGSFGKYIFGMDARTELFRQLQKTQTYYCL